MTRDLDATDLTINHLIGAWALKHRVLMTAAAMEELEGELLRPVFVERDALREALHLLVQWYDHSELYSMDSLIARLAQARAALAPARVGEEMG